MVEAKLTACAKIPKELYELSIQRYTKISIAIIAGLELLRDKESIQNEEKHEDNGIRYAELQNRLDNIQKENERLQEINEILKRELEGTRQDKEDLKLIHSDYMAQMQMILKQRVIEAPGKKKWFEFWK
jgi:hypothetical protein